MIRKTLILLGLIYINGCSGVVFERGLNYEKTPKYAFKYDQSSHDITIFDKKNQEHVNMAFGKGSSCGFYGLIGPLIFPIIPFWENRDCDNVVIKIWEYYSNVKIAYITYNNKIIKPYEITKTGYHKFPIKTKSITDTALLIVRKENGAKFEIPFRYQHTFSFDLWPGR